MPWFCVLLAQLFRLHHRFVERFASLVGGFQPDSLESKEHGQLGVQELLDGDRALGPESRLGENS